MPRSSASRMSATPSSSLLAPYTPDSDMQPNPIAETAMPDDPSIRLGSFANLFMCHPFRSAPRCALGASPSRTQTPDTPSPRQCRRPARPIGRDTRRCGGGDRGAGCWEKPNSEDAVPARSGNGVSAPAMVCGIASPCRRDRSSSRRPARARGQPERHDRRHGQAAARHDRGADADHAVEAVPHDDAHGDVCSQHIARRADRVGDAERQRRKPVDALALRWTRRRPRHRARRKS